MKIIPLSVYGLLWILAATMDAQSYKVLVNFNEAPSGPESQIIAQSRGGYLVTTADDSGNDPGTAFRITTSGELTVLHEFDTTDGATPSGGLTLGRNGRFYGTAETGGANGFGTVFEMTPDGLVKTLHDFAGGSGGGSPTAPPIQSLYGDFYGTTFATGGIEGMPGVEGSVYKITEDGSFTLLHGFSGPDGDIPWGPLVQATNYWFYGTTAGGGTHGDGTIFRISSKGEFESLFNFDGTHGKGPYAELIQAYDGDFYGVAVNGGAHNSGVVFRMTPKNQVTVLYDFTGGSDGSGPIGGLVQATNGYLYGTTEQGGAYGGGVLFRISTSGDFKVVHNFQQSTGSDPQNTLIQHTDGFLYGETVFGGSYGQGVFFRFDLGLPAFVTYLPSYGRVGMTVQILGDGFTDDTQVFFNDVKAEVTEVEPTYLRAIVPDGASTGPITVTTTKGVLKGNKPFIVRP